MYSDTADTIAVGSEGEPDEEVAIEVDMPVSLLVELDAYAARNGYASPDGVVRDAIERWE